MSEVVDYNAETMWLDWTNKESQSVQSSKSINSVKEEIMLVEDDECGREDQ